MNFDHLRNRQQQRLTSRLVQERHGKLYLVHFLKKAYSFLSENVVRFAFQDLLDSKYCSPDI